MCTPIGMAILGGGQAVMANQASDIANRYAKRSEALNTENAISALVSSYKQRGTQQTQEQMSRGEEMRMIARKSARVKASVTVRGAAGGVAGTRVLSAVADQYEKDALQAMGVREREGEFSDINYLEANKAAEAQAQGRVQAGMAPEADSSMAQFLNVVMGAGKGYMAGSQLSGTPDITADVASAAGGAVGPLPIDAAPTSVMDFSQQFPNPFMPTGPMQVDPSQLMGFSPQQFPNPFEWTPMNETSDIFSFSPIGPMSMFGVRGGSRI